MNESSKTIINTFLATEYQWFLKILLVVFMVYQHFFMETNKLKTFFLLKKLLLC